MGSGASIQLWYRGKSGSVYFNPDRSDLEEYMALPIEIYRSPSTWTPRAGSRDGLLRIGTPQTALQQIKMNNLRPIHRRISLIRHEEPQR